MQNYLLGIDIGTGSTKAVAMYPDGHFALVVKESYPTQTPSPGFSEQDPEQIWQAFVKCVAAVSAELGNPANIGLSSAMHSLIPVDSNGKAIGPMLTWADTRSNTIAKGLRNSPEGQYAYHTSGTPVHPMSPLCKLSWLKQNQPQLFNKAYKFISIKEYVWYRLFNEFQIDYSIASATGLFNIRQFTWDDKLCTLAGITADKLSEPVDAGFTRQDLNTNIAAQLHVARDTPITIGASDGCCANLGSEATQPGVAAVTIGTSGAIRIASQQPVDDYNSMVFNYLLNKNMFICGGAINNGGAAADWLLKTYTGYEPDTAGYKQLSKTISTITPGSEGLLFLPYLYGERAPLWDGNASGAFLNIKAGHKPAHFLRAGLEGICYALNDVLVTLEESSGIKVQQLNVSGGFVNSMPWMQLLADITGKKLTLMHTEDASAIGAIYLAMQAMQTPTKKTDNKDIKFIIPDLNNHQLYIKNFRIFKTAYSAIKQTIYQLNNLD